MSRCSKRLLTYLFTYLLTYLGIVSKYVTDVHVKRFTYFYSCHVLRF